MWFSRGPLFDVIRASISIPTVFRPHHYEGRTLVDGGLLNPVPVTPTLRDLTDCTIAVDVNGPDEDPAGQGTTTGDATFGDMDEALAANEHVEALPAPANEAGGALTTSRRKIASFIDGLLEKREKRHAERAADPGALELFARTLDVVQQTVTRVVAQPCLI